MLDWIFSAQWPLWPSIVSFAIAAGIVAWLGIKMGRLAQVLARRTGMGEALTGALLLGLSTSIPGVVAVVTAGVNDQPEVAVSTGLGGIIAQTSFLVIADLLYKRHNLEYDATTPDNMATGMVLISMLMLVVVALVSPEINVFGIHPATIALPLAYLGGLHVVNRIRKAPGWLAVHKDEHDAEQPTDPERIPPPEEAHGEDATYTHLGNGALAARFAVVAAVVALCGWVLARSGMSIGAEFGLADSLVGSLLIGQATSLPELLTAVAAVRIGAPVLAIGDIVGGNMFDVLFVAIGDVAYPEGSIYHAVSDQSAFLAAMGVLATTMLLLGLLRRQKRGFLHVGFEGTAIFLVYIGGYVALFFW
jgi:cation:H+ antiporter